MESTQRIAKIKLKVGTMELEYEGDPSFLIGGIEALLVTMGSLAENAPSEIALPKADGLASPAHANGKETSTPKGTFTFSTNTIAAHLEAKSAPELVICAMSQLALVQGKSPSSRLEIIAEMKSATNYYKQHMVGNLSGSLSGLVKAKRINETAKDTFALSASERKTVEAKIAGIE